MDIGWYNQETGNWDKETPDLPAFWKGKQLDANELIRALVLEYVGAGMSEGVYFGSERTSKLIDEYIEATGGHDYWQEQLVEEWKNVD